MGLAQIEYLVVNYDDDKKEVRLSLRQADILEALANDEKLTEQGGGVPDLQFLEKKYGDIHTIRKGAGLTTAQTRQDCARLSPRVWSLYARDDAW